MFEHGDKVNTPLGKGRIAYRRMKGENFSEVEAYSVVLNKCLSSVILFPKDVSNDEENS